MKKSFTPEYERAVLSALVQDLKFLKEAIPVLRPDHFVDQQHAAAAKVIGATYMRTQAAPSKVGLLSGLVDEMRRVIKTKKQDQDETLILAPARTLCDQLFTPIQAEDVKGDFLRFSRQREIENTFLECYQKLDSGEFEIEAAFENMRRTQQRTSMQHQGGTDFFPTIEDLPADLLEMKKRTYTTGFPTLDLKMGGGGGAGTLTTYIAPPKCGKSMILVNTSYANLLRGRVVIHFTLEISEKKIKKRYASRITGVPLDDLSDKSATVVEKVAQFWDLHKPRLFLKGYPPNTVGCDTFRAYVQWVESTYEVKPDLLIIDYGDLVRPSTKQDQLRLAQSEAYTELRAMAQELDVAIFTASQGNRDALNKQIVRMQDIAESIGKAAISDHLISICRTEEEDRQNKARLYFAGSREAEAGGQVALRVNWGTCLMAESGERIAYDDGF